MSLSEKKEQSSSRTLFSSAWNDELYEDRDTEFLDCTGVMDWSRRQIMSVKFSFVKLRKCIPSLAVCCVCNCAYSVTFQVRVLLCILHFLHAPCTWIFFLVFSCSRGNLLLWMCKTGLLNPYSVDLFFSDPREKWTEYVTNTGSFFPSCIFSSRKLVKIDSPSPLLWRSCHPIPN